MSALQTHPSDLALEAVLIRRGAPEQLNHVASCAECRQRLARMEDEGREFTARVYPATLDRVLAGRGRFRWPALLMFPALAAAALLLFVRRDPPAEEYVGTKGAALELHAFVDSPSGVNEVRDGDPLAAAAALRFRVRAAQPCELWLLSVDAEGGVSRLLPAEGEPAPRVRGTQTLPGGVVLDGQGGPERFFAVCSPEHIDFPALQALARRAAGGAGAVRAGRVLDGLPRRALQTSLLVEKRP
jgi:hypothetical protein